MQKGIIGKKIGMTQIFDEAGKVIPVTVVEAAPSPPQSPTTSTEKSLSPTSSPPEWAELRHR